MQDKPLPYYAEIITLTQKDAAMYDERAWLTTCLSNADLVAQLRTISLIICDVDGSLTNGAMTYETLTNQWTKGFSFLDGIGIKMLQEASISVAFVSGHESPATRARAAKLGITSDLCHIVPCQKKPTVVASIQEKLNTPASSTLVFGDDLPDLALIKLCSLFACPLDVLFYIASRADLVSPRPGGHGAFRSIADLILYARNQHPFQSTIRSALL